MEWALMEASQGHAETARELFKVGAEGADPHMPLVLAWSR